MTKRELKAIQESIKSMRMERAYFDSIAPSLDPPEEQLPTNESQVTPFIKARTRLYINSWCIGPLQEIVNKYESKWSKK